MKFLSGSIFFLLLVLGSFFVSPQPVQAQSPQNLLILSETARNSSKFQTEDKSETKSSSEPTPLWLLIGVAVVGGMLPSVLIVGAIRKSKSHTAEQKYVTVNRASVSDLNVSLSRK